MDEEIETHESEAEVPANSLALVGLTSGVWYCCGCNGGRSRVRFSRSSCRRAGCAYRTCDGGDFILGILLAYGFISPLATVLRQKSAETSKMMQCVKVTLLSNLNGYAPPIAVEFRSKTLYSSEHS